MQRISTVLPSVLRRRGLHEHAGASLSVAKAQAWLDDRLPAFRDMIRAVGLRDGALVVECGHSVASQECQASATALFDYLRKDMPNVAISAVRVVRARRTAST